jgi:2-polyprenyl-3-methyl-5-hydroxy-6-metoxy-1,4-benzoquinol methylase
MMAEDITCYLCNARCGTLIKDLYDTRHGVTGSFSIYVCPSCGLGATHSVQENLSALYERVLQDRSRRWYREWYQTLVRSSLGARVRLHLDRANSFLNLLSFTGLPQNARLLDIGCGIGDWMMLFRSQGLDVYGVDLNPKAVQIAVGRGLNVRCMHAEGLAKDNERFDVVVLSQLLEHIRDPVSLLLKLHDLLRPGGKLLIAVPNLNSRYRERLGRNWINWYVPFHLFHYTESSLRLILSRAGYEIVQIADYTPPSWWLGSWMVRWFGKGEGVRNNNVAAWWHIVLYPALRCLLALEDRIYVGTGDCLCVLATRKGCRNDM